MGQLCTSPNTIKDPNRTEFGRQPQSPSQLHNQHVFQNSVAPLDTSLQPSSLRSIQINDILASHDARQKFADYVKKEKEIDFASPSIEEIEECFPYVQEMINSYVTSRHEDEKKHAIALAASTSIDAAENVIESKLPTSLQPEVAKENSILSTEGVPMNSSSVPTNPDDDTKLRNEFLLLLTLHTLPSYNQAIAQSTDKTVSMRSSRKFL